MPTFFDFRSASRTTIDTYADTELRDRAFGAKVTFDRPLLNELATLSPGDLVVHADHGIGRYEGLTQIPVQKAPHDCVALEYAGGDKLYVPVENIDVLSRYGGAGDTAALDRLFPKPRSKGEDQPRRHARQHGQAAGSGAVSFQAPGLRRAGD